MSETTVIIVAFLCAAAGFAAAWAVQAFRAKADRGVPKDEYAAAQQALEAARGQTARLEERSSQTESSLQRERQTADELRTENTALHRKLAAADERAAALEARLAEGQQELERLQKKLAADFENLANRIFDEKSKTFVAQNKESLDKLLQPLGQRIVDFRDRVEKTHEQAVKDHASLAEQLKAMGVLNLQMTTEARNLANALKGQTKTQGNWGELILTRVLEKSGLVAGREYEEQVSVVAEDGRRLQPDVVINLPEGKKLVVDSKVSLVAYERAVNAENDDARAVALKEHVSSLRGHIGDLGKKRYDALYQIESPDFVLLFVPVEPAFTLAMQADDTLFDAAFRQNVVVVTPSTLLATLRTVASIWRQELQVKNAQEIASRGAALYDKFANFAEDLLKIGERLQQATQSYDGAVNKLTQGPGNLVRQAEMLRELGAHPKKSLPKSLSAPSEEE